MAWNFEYPYVDSKNYNDDWLLKTIKEIIKQLDDFVNLNTIKYANPIAWDITRQFEKNTVVVDSRTGNAYISTNPVPSGVQINNTDYWTSIYNYEHTLGLLRAQIATDEGDRTTATQNFSVGDLVFTSGLLYKVIAPMIAGDSFVVDSNIEKTTIAEELKALSDYFDNVIGDLTELETEVKITIVAAINELVGSINTITSNIGDLSQLETEVKSSLVAAINELHNTPIIDDYVNVKDYGAVGDGVTDDTQAILDAISYARNNNKFGLVFPDGFYKVTDVLGEYTGGQLHLKGLPYARINFNGTTDSDFIKFTQCWYGITDLAIFTSENHNGSIITIDNVNGGTIKNCSLYYGDTAVKFIGNVNTFANMILESDISQQSSAGILFDYDADGGDGTNHNKVTADTFISNCNISGNSNRTGYGILMHNCYGLYLNNVDIISCYIGIYGESSNALVGALFLENLLCDTSKYWGMWLNGVSNNQMFDIGVVNSWFVNSNDVTLDGGGLWIHGCRHVRVSNCTVYANIKRGAYLSEIEDVAVTGCNIYANSINTHCNLYLFQCRRAAVSGNVLGGVLSGRQYFSEYIATNPLDVTSSNHIVVTGNIFTGNTSSEYTGVANNAIIRNNEGQQEIKSIYIDKGVATVNRGSSLYPTVTFDKSGNPDTSQLTWYKSSNCNWIDSNNKGPVNIPADSTGQLAVIGCYWKADPRVRAECIIYINDTP